MISKNVTTKNHRGVRQLDLWQCFLVNLIFLCYYHVNNFGGIDALTPVATNKERETTQLIMLQQSAIYNDMRQNITCRCFLCPCSQSSLRGFNIALIEWSLTRNWNGVGKSTGLNNNWPRKYMLSHGVSISIHQWHLLKLEADREPSRSHSWLAIGF